MIKITEESLLVTDTAQDACRLKKVCRPVKKLRDTHKKIGIAFGGGGLRGTAHLGVLKVLEEYGVPVHMVAGTSIGSAVAALYGAGMDWRKMKVLFDHYDVESMIKVRPGKMGLVPADGYTELIRICTKGKKIEELDLPVKIVAVDLMSYSRVLFDEGDTAIAVRASSAIPGVFTPVEMGDMVLVDGFVLDNCPGDVVRDMGADVVLAISLHANNYNQPQNILDVVQRSLDVAATAYQTIDADLILEPIDRHMGSLNVNAMEECFMLGERCARAHIDQILQLIEG